jgi:alpha-amylase/alpha-mannosidase (GH57 family)
MSNKKLGLVILWHQHQPYYKNSSGVYQMPWVRFHSTKDYLDLLLVLKEFPDIKQNFNLVPSLLLQIEDYVQNNAKDNIWELTEKPANKLQPDEKEKILDNFFLTNVNTMIKPYRRYYELYLKSKVYLKNEPVERQIAAFTPQDYRDLQVWYNLTWIGVESRKKAGIQKFFKKGKNFTEADKNSLLKEIKEILSQIIPLHKELWEKGQIEISTTPFYHPILPLLCDNHICQEAAPGIPVPKHHFNHTEDAEAQIENGLAHVEKIFGKRPDGMWPSEGSVSTEALEIIARKGVKWVASDEGILSKTLDKSFSHLKIYQPYCLETEKNSIHVFFRDHYLSDAIGFVYSNWSAERAVADFMERLHAIRKMLIDQHGESFLDQFVIPIILDGENCWEYYADDGKPFLRNLYQTLTENKFIQTTTFGEVLKKKVKTDKISTIFPGSWINSNFNIWIGSEEDNKSWDLLSETRKFLVEKAKEGIFSDETIQKAWERIYIAEGSDWNWWYGDEHASANDMEFDQLYREHLMDVYHLLNTDVPAILYQPIKRTYHDRFVSTRPKNFIHPKIDGEPSYFFEWVGAACYDVAKSPQSSMHQVSQLMDKIYVGFDDKNLYLRLDFHKKPDPLTEFVIAVKSPSPSTIVLSPLRGVMEKYVMKNEIQEKTSIEPVFRMNHILEMAIPFNNLAVQVGETIGFQILLKLNGQLLEEFPRMNLIEVEVPSESFDLIEWSV